MKKYEGVVQDEEGDIITHATITVKDYVGVANSTIYAADALGSNINGFTNNSDGTFEFFAIDGRYNIEISKPGITTKVITNVLMEHTPGIPSAKGYGAVGDGVIDDTAAINAALAANKSVFMHAGTYIVSGNVACTLQGQKLYGAGPTATVISVNTAANPGITIAAGLNNVDIGDFTLTRTVAATAGGNGIDCSTVTIGQSRIHDLVVQNQYDGLALGPTDYGCLENIITQTNYRHGIYITSTASDGACQWNIKGQVLSQKNTLDGLRVVSIAGPSQMSVGNINGLSTFANTGRGIIVLANSGVPIHGVRISNCFLGEDGDSEIYLETYGGQHQISSTFLELAGTRTTGRTLATAAANAGHGILVTSNNEDCLLSIVHANGNSQNGFAVQATVNSLTGCQATNNGVAATATHQNGIRVLGTARATITGGRLGNRTGTLQKYGVYGADGANIALIGVDLTNNNTAVWNMVANEASMIVMGCFPPDTRVGLSPSGAVLVGLGATGDWNAAGSINVANGIYKNDTAYTNP